MSSRSRVKKSAGDLIDWEAVSLQDDECRVGRGFKLKDKLKDEKFEESRETMVEMLSGRELNVQYMQTSGFTKPIIISRRDDLGLKIPHREFSIDGIRSSVGSRRMLNVLDARTQKSRPMCMKEWCKYCDSEPVQWKTTSIVLQMKDNLKRVCKWKMTSDLFLNGRRPESCQLRLGNTLIPA